MGRGSQGWWALRLWGGWWGALTVGRKALGRTEFQEPKAGEGPRDWGSCQLRLQQGWGGREGKGAGQ